MITVKDAEHLILDNVPEAAKLSRPLGQLHGEILREPISADRPLPPFDRVAMDGIAISYAAWSGGQRSFETLGDHRAGDPIRSLEDSKKCWEVMTGAVLPTGCDCVIKIEDLNVEDGSAHLNEGVELKQHQNIHQMGTDCEQGTLLLKPGAEILAPQSSIIASVGKIEVQVSQRPKIAIISTGDELVEVAQVPEPHQIRRSNVHGISTSLMAFGFQDIKRYHLPDHKEEMLGYLSEILRDHEVVILSGGVSKGKYDFVPQVLTDLGVQRKFHKVKQKPGKPLWFGVGRDKQLVFGLPGNPISAVICLHRYVMPALAKYVGSEKFATNIRKKAVLQKSVNFKKKMTLFQPVKISYTAEGQVAAEPIQTNGSGDFSSLAESDGFIELTEDRESFQPGEVYTVWTWRV